ncbi:hypothetical protein [Streptomyces sp. NPDC047315]|uniref:hypothetical protein n=1 Tax=Streptomyces sp. NPDC047315 TaxID=3155142 RepID=UPI0033F7528F
MTEPSPHANPGPEHNPYAREGEPEYQWGPDTPPGTPAYGYPAPGYGYPNQAPNYAQTQPSFPVPMGTPLGTPYGAPGAPVPLGAPLVTIGDIVVMHDTIVTPAGHLPLKGAVWNVTDMSRTEEKIPAHAIVLAVVFFFVCFLGLLFLLMKEKKTTGFVQVSVTSGGKHHVTMVPALHAMTVQHVMGQVNYARSLSAM